MHKAGMERDSGRVRSKGGGGSDSGTRMSWDDNGDGYNDASTNDIDT